MPKKYLQLKPEDEAKAQARAARRDSQPKITDEHLLIAEFGMYYGWEAIQAVLSDEVDTETFTWLLEAARRIDARNQYNAASGTFTAIASANTKRPGAEFKKHTDAYRKAMRPDA